MDVEINRFLGPRILGRIRYIIDISDRVPDLHMLWEQALNVPNLSFRCQPPRLVLSINSVQLLFFHDLCRRRSWTRGTARQEDVGSLGGVVRLGRYNLNVACCNPTEFTETWILVRT